MYVKLFASILNSSLWSLAATTRVLFITMLELADREGFVYGSAGGLARQANITREECERGLADLSEPDNDSSDLTRNPDNEGRRIETLETGGWRVLNFTYYRNLRDEDMRREQNRAAKSAQRDRDRHQKSASVSIGQHRSAQTERKSEEETEIEKDSKALVRLSPDAFESVWSEYPSKVKRKSALTAFRASVKTPEDLAAIKTALKNYKAHLAANPTRPPQNGGTWFANWRDEEWQSPPQDRPPEAKHGDDRDRSPDFTVSRRPIPKVGDHDERGWYWSTGHWRAYPENDPEAMMKYLRDKGLIHD